jgi:thiol-disulfide isomerase/thioredoxin
MKKPLLIALLLAVASGTASLDSLTPFVQGSWRQLLQSHRNTPLLVHFWGITCAPCMAELPRWGVLAHEHPEAAIVFVSADPVQIDRTVIEAAIVKAGIGNAENWLLSDAFAERVRYEVNPQWIGELPHTALIAGDGRTSFVSGVVDMPEIERWLRAQAPGKGGR